METFHSNPDTFAKFSAGVKTYLLGGLLPKIFTKWWLGVRRSLERNWMAWVAMTHPSDKGVFSNAFTNDLLRNLGEPGRHNWKAHKYPYLFVPELGVLVWVNMIGL